MLSLLQSRNEFWIVKIAERLLASLVEPHSNYLLYRHVIDEPLWHLVEFDLFPTVLAYFVRRFTKMLTNVSSPAHIRVIHRIDQPICSTASDVSEVQVSSFSTLYFDFLLNFFLFGLNLNLFFLKRRDNFSVKASYIVLF